ncbi:YbhB/YbcL family Raf kinase inhibitor-like protein [Candidatus Micrarchaeota archaeon]|nr:YbhB/YbcL family Raf kinase inhibitor-like protein [Candidatus Micrarchaeota archaeon]
MKKLTIIILGFILLFGCFGIGGKQAGTQVSKIMSGKTGSQMAIKTTSFLAGGNIPMKYTCDGQNVNPQIAFENTPRETKTFGLLVEDIDSGQKFTHLVVWNIPNKTKEIKVGEIDGLQGKNSFGTLGYSGPCPPEGEQHTYKFKAYALDTELALPEGSTKEEFQKTIGGHVLAEAEITGEYKRNYK